MVYDAIQKSADGKGGAQGNPELTPRVGNGRGSIVKETQIKQGREDVCDARQTTGWKMVWSLSRHAQEGMAPKDHEDVL